MRTAVFGGALFASPPTDPHSNPCKAFCLAHDWGEETCNKVSSGGCKLLGEESSACGSLYWLNSTKKNVIVYNPEVARGGSNPPRAFVKVTCREAFRDIEKRHSTIFKLSSYVAGLVHPAPVRTEGKKTVRFNDDNNHEQRFLQMPSYDEHPVEGQVSFERAMEIFTRLDQEYEIEPVEDPGSQCPTGEITAEGIHQPIRFDFSTMGDRQSMLSKNGWYTLERADSSPAAALNKHLSQALWPHGTVRAYKITSMSPSCEVSFALYEISSESKPLGTVSSERIMSNELLLEIAENVLRIVKEYHESGFVHTDLKHSFVWSGESPSMISLGNLGYSRLFFIPGTHNHVPIDGCELSRGQIRAQRDEEGNISCVSRALDMQDLAEFLQSLVVPGHMAFAGQSAIDKFAAYTSTLWLTEAPNYDEWIEYFHR